jgi:hypothetical protein
MIDIANDNLDNELYLQRHKSSLKNGKIIDLRTEEEIINERDFWKKSTKDKMFMPDKNNPKNLEYWRNVFPSKTDNELEEYIDRWGKENPKYLKFNRL